MADLVPSTRLAAPPFNERHIGRFPVERTKIISPQVPDLVATVTTTESRNLNGQVVGIITAAPDIPTDANFTIALINEDGITEYTSGNIADDGNVFTDIESDKFHAVGQYTIKVTFSTALSGDTATFDIQFKVLTP